MGSIPRESNNWSNMYLLWIKASAKCVNIIIIWPHAQNNVANTMDRPVERYSSESIGLNILKALARVTRALQTYLPKVFPTRDTRKTMMYPAMSTHSYCLGCKYSLQMYLRSSSSSSTWECEWISVEFRCCADVKQSSQASLTVIPDMFRADPGSLPSIADDWHRMSEGERERRGVKPRVGWRRDATRISQPITN